MAHANTQRISALLIVMPDEAKKTILAAIKKAGGVELDADLPTGGRGRGGDDRLPTSVSAAAAALHTSMPTMRRWLKALRLDTYSRLARALGSPGKRPPLEKEEAE